MRRAFSFFKSKNVSKAEGVKWIISNLIRLVLVIAIFTALINLRWTALFVSLIVLFLTYSPNFFEKKYDIDIPAEFEIITILFIFASIFLGEVHGYYTKFLWWDVLLHAGSAIAFGFIGFILMYVLYKGDKIRGSPVVIVIFSFSFAVAIGAVWEVFEFGMDSLFGFNMQKSGLVDTMWDLIVDIVGAFIASLIGYFYLRTGESFFFDRIIKDFEKENKRFFK